MEKIGKVSKKERTIIEKFEVFGGHHVTTRKWEDLIGSNMVTSQKFKILTSNPPKNLKLDEGKLWVIW